MAEYIKREDVLFIINASCFDLEYNSENIALQEEIKLIPVADVVDVVRCRDCKWCHTGYCEKYDDLIPFGCANKPWDDWFCADGEKKNG